MSKKITSIVLMLVILISCGYFSYYWYTDNKFIENVTPSLKNISIRTTVSAEYLFEDGMTFIELFSRLDENIKEIDNKIIGIKTIKSVRHANLVHLILEYANASKAIIRIEREYFRQRLKQKTISELTDKYIEDLRSVNSFTREYAEKEINNNINKLKELQSESELNTQEFVSAIEKLYKTRSKLLDYFDGSDLVETNTLDMISKLPGAKTSGLAEKGAEPPADRTWKIVLRNVRQRVIVNEKSGPVFIIEGKAVNTFDAPKEHIRVEATLYDAAGNVLSGKQMLCGNTLSQRQLQAQTEEEINIGLTSEVGVLSNNTFLKPGMDTPFMIVFFNPPKNIKEFGVKVIDARDPAQ